MFIAVNICTPSDRGMVLLQFGARGFYTKKLCSWLSSILFTKTTNSLFEPPFGGIMGSIRTSTIARWKARGRLPIRDNWNFFAGSYGWDVMSRYWSMSAFFRGGCVTLTVNFRWKGTSPPTIVGVRKARVFLLPHSEDCMILSSFIWVQYQHVTDRQTDRQ